MSTQRLSFGQPILIVDDDRDTTDLWAKYLAGEGFCTIAAHDGREALELAARYRLLCAILDVVLPDIDGWEICRRLRKISNVPILMVSGQGTMRDRVRGLTLGADDYLVKPVELPELGARIKALLRRASMPQSLPESSSFGSLCVDFGRHAVMRNAQPLFLTSSELRILEVLMSAPGRTHTRRELLACLYPNGGVVIERVIDVHVRRLRQKIEDDATHPHYVLTTRGLGYRFADAPLNIQIKDVASAAQHAGHAPVVHLDC